MSSPSEARRITGILRFLADLESVAAECVATGVWGDELASRRRLRGDSGSPDEAAIKEPQVKAL